MQTEWVMTRLSKGTHVLLEKVRQGMLRAYEQGNYSLVINFRGHLSLDQVVMELAYEKLKHRARARDSKRRAAERRRMARIESNAQQAADPGGEPQEESNRDEKTGTPEATAPATES